MSERLSYVRLFFDDFEGGIIQLTSHERGVYFTLCLRYWATKRCLFDDDRTLARACNCSVQSYKKAKAKLIEMGKIAVVDGKVYQPRADAEYEESLKDWERYNRWQRNKNRKKIEKSSRSFAEKSNENSIGAAQPKPEGFGTSKEVIQNLTPDGALALEGLRAACVTDHTRDEIAKLEQCITGWRDKVFLVTGKYAVERFSLSLAKELHASGLSLEVGSAQQPHLKTIEGGRR